METVLVLLAPFVVSVVAEGVKRLKVIDFSVGNKTVGRAIIALLALSAVVGQSVLADEPVDIASVEVAVNTFFNALAATGVYFLAKSR